MKILIQSTVAALAVAIATPAFASSITLGNLSTGLGRTVKTNLTGGSTYHAGQLNWNVTAIDGSAAALTGLSVGDSISTFCTEFTQLASAPSVFNVVNVEDAPQPGAGMGALRAGYINTLYAQYYGQAFDSATHAAAFQLAVWEIVHESETTVAAEAFDSSVGDFRATGGNVFNVQSGQSMTAVALANTWLSSLGSLFNSNGANMFALTNDSSQDQLMFINIIPLPAPLLLAGMGLAIVPVLRRRMAS